MKQILVHRHFIGSAHSFEITTIPDKTPGKETRPDVTILKTFFIDDTVNVNDWQATWEGLKLDAEELPGVPLVLQEDLEHPKFSVQDMYDRGTIFDYDIDEENHKIIVYVRITDLKIVERIISGELEFVSPAVIPRGSESLRNEGGVDILDRTLPLHLAIVSNPAYGKDKAKISHICSGDGAECYHRLKTMTAQKKYQDKEKEAEGEGDGGDGGNTGIKSKLKIKKAEGIPELEQIPFIKKMVASVSMLNSSFTKKITGTKFHIHNGREGYWMVAKGLDVFVARGESISDAVLDQCGCNKLS